MINLSDADLIAINPVADRDAGTNGRGLSTADAEAFREQFARARAELGVVDEDVSPPLVVAPSSATLLAIPSAFPLLDPIEQPEPPVDGSSELASLLTGADEGTESSLDGWPSTGGLAEAWSLQGGAVDGRPTSSAVADVWPSGLTEGGPMGITATNVDRLASTAESNGNNISAAESTAASADGDERPSDTSGPPRKTLVDTSDVENIARYLIREAARTRGSGPHAPAATSAPSSGTSAGLAPSDSSSLAFSNAISPVGLSAAVDAAQTRSAQVESGPTSAAIPPNLEAAAGLRPLANGGSSEAIESPFTVALGQASNTGSAGTAGSAGSTETRAEPPVSAEHAAPRTLLEERSTRYASPRGPHLETRAPTTQVEAAHPASPAGKGESSTPSAAATPDVESSTPEPLRPPSERLRASHSAARTDLAVDRDVQHDDTTRPPAGLEPSPDTANPPSSTELPPTLTVDESPVDSVVRPPTFETPTATPDSASASAPRASRAEAQQLLTEAMTRFSQQLNEQSWERRFSIDLRGDDGLPVRLTIQPDGEGQHRVAFLVAHARLRDELRRSMPEIRDAVAHFPVTVSDVSIDAFPAFESSARSAVSSRDQDGVKRDE